MKYLRGHILNIVLGTDGSYLSTHSEGLLLELGLSPRTDGLRALKQGVRRSGLNPHPALLAPHCLPL